MILLDGQPSDHPLLLDRGLAYGDGLFETVALRDGKLLAWDAHVARLARGCAALAMPAPDIGRLLSEALAVAAGQARGVIKIVLTRGEGGRGYRPPAAAAARRIVSLHPWPADLDEHSNAGRVAWVCRQRLGHQPALAGIKHLNRLEQVLASAEWPAPEYFEGLMLDLDGYLIEGTRSNVFVLRDNILLTPDLSRCGIAGVVREAILDFAPRLGLQARVTSLELAQVKGADALFLCNSIMGLRELTRLDHDGQSLSFSQRGRTHELASALRAADLVP